LQLCSLQDLNHGWQWEVEHNCNEQKGWACPSWSCWINCNEQKAKHVPHEAAESNKALLLPSDTPQTTPHPIYTALQTE
jgi:hypothetical protein